MRVVEQDRPVGSSFCDDENMVAQELLARKVREKFPIEQSNAVLDLLSELTDDWVALGVLKLADGDADRLLLWLDAASIGEDVLAVAEIPVR